MSLQVWLPLNGNVKDLGISDVRVENNGAIINNNGKIGKCYDFGNSGSYLKFAYPASNLQGEWSFCCWIKPTDFTNYNSLFCNRKSVSYGISIFIVPGTGLVRFDNGTDSVTSCKTFNTALTINTWLHLCLVLTSTSRLLYIDGILKETISASSVSSGNTAKNAFIGASSGNDSTVSGNYFKGSLNDVRIYNHALSTKEAKELAKGLILHYPLNNKYLEETTNLITSEDALSNTCYNGATSKYGYGVNSDIYKTVTTFLGQKGTKVYMGTNGNNARPYSYINDMFVSDGTNKPAYKTLSFDYYTNIGTYISPYKLGSGNGTATWKVFNGVTTTGTYTNSGNIPIETNKWNHIEITFHGTTAANCEWGYIINGALHVSNTNNFWFYANVQLEEKDHATGYIPYGTHKNKETIESDCSGYKQDGIITGTLTAAADTPRYRTSYYFDGIDSAIQVPYNATVFLTNFTINLWFKKTELGSKDYETLFGGPSGFEMDTRNSNSTTLSLYMTSTRGGNAFSSFSFGEWYMVTMVNDGTNELYYINGELKKTIEKKSMPTGNYFIGAWSTSSKQNFKGYISDFRIYCTALSADDVKALYEDAGYVDKNGNFHAYEFVEG